MNPSELWTLSLAASPALGALVAWGRARRHRVVRTAAQGPVLTTIDGVSEGATVTLSGRLLAAQAPTEGGRVIALYVEPREGESRNVSIEGLRVKLDGGAELEIEGAVRVEVGSHEAPDWDDLGELEVPVAAWVVNLFGCAPREVRTQTRCVRALCHDDPVLVRAKLEARPDEGTGDGAYREMRVRHALVPDGVFVGLYGRGPRARSKASSMAKGALVGAVAMALFWTFVGMIAGGLSRGGRSSPAWEGRRLYEQFRGSAFAAQVAMVSPLERKRAHHTLAESLRDQRRPTRDDLARARVELLAAGDCAGAVDLAMAHGDAREARYIDQHARCDGPRPPVWTRAMAAYAAGDFADASELFASSTSYVDLYASYIDDYAFDVRLHVLAGDGESAARVASRRATTWSARRSAGDRVRVMTTLSCLAAWEGAKRGDAVKRRELQERAEGSDAPQGCVLLYLDAIEREQRLTSRHLNPATSHERVAALLAWEAGRAPSVGSPCGEDWSALVNDPVGAMSRRAPGIEHALLRAPGYDDGDEVWRAQVDLRCSLAAFEALAGDTAASMIQLNDAYARISEARTRGAEWASVAFANVERLRDRLREVFAPGDAIVVPMPEGDIGRDPAAYLFTHAWNGVPAWVEYGGPVDARVASGVAQWLDVAAPPPCVRCPVRRRLAELVVARRAARRWGNPGVDEGLLANFARALRERRLAVPLRVLDDLREHAQDLSW